tara:strand:+ start:6415 stop:6855 length:441 start_codon:yes stop_codon:yes gene_type:complete
MPSYLSHLLADIRAAHRTDSPEEKPELTSLEEHFREIDRWVSGDAEHTLGYYCGLDAKSFPPPDQLRDEDIKKICDVFAAMLNSWSFDLDIPDELPLQRKYQLMIGLLNHECTPLNAGRYVFDFCSGYAPGCELKEFCRCLEFWEK